MTRRKKKDSPISDEAIKNKWPLWNQSCLSRIESGKIAYGDKSFTAEPLELIRMVKEELFDTSNWSFILYCRLCAIERALTEALGRALTDAAGQLETAADPQRRDCRPA